jgi:hypothetical protein
MKTKSPPVDRKHWRTTDQWEKMGHNIRFRAGLYADCAKLASQFPMSTNEFINQAIQATVDLINAPEDKALTAPQIIRLARIMKHAPDMVVTMKEG